MRVPWPSVDRGDATGDATTMPRKGEIGALSPMNDPVTTRAALFGTNEVPDRPAARLAPPSWLSEGRARPWVQAAVAVNLALPVTPSTGGFRSARGRFRAIPWQADGAIVRARKWDNCRALRVFLAVRIAEPGP